MTSPTLTCYLLHNFEKTSQEVIFQIERQNFLYGSQGKKAIDLDLTFQLVNKASKHPCRQSLVPTVVQNTNHQTFLLLLKLHSIQQLLILRRFNITLLVGMYLLKTSFICKHSNPLFLADDPVEILFNPTFLVEKGKCIT